LPLVKSVTSSGTDTIVHGFDTLAHTVVGEQKIITLQVRGR
jgi:hypothetical protein